MIFNKKFDEITFSDIEEMVETKYRENMVLDYKRDFSNNHEIAKLVSAFANTYGGFIIFGVDEEQDTNKPSSIYGLSESEKQLESRLVDITVDCIEPYVQCEYKILTSEDKTKKVLVVRIPESDLSPHGVEKNTVCYIRVNDHKRRVERANFDKIEWLKNKRQKYVNLCNKITGRMGKNSLFESLKNESDEYVIETLLGPQFPKIPLQSTNELFNFLNLNINIFNNRNATIFSVRDANHINDGLCILVKKNEVLSYYLEYNRYGYILVRLFLKIRGDATHKYANIYDICINLLHGHMLGFELINACNYFGSILLRTKVSNIKNTLISDDLPGYGRFQVHQWDYECHVEPEDCFESICRSGDHEGQLRAHAIEVVSQILFLYGVKDDVNDCSHKLVESIAKGKTFLSTSKGEKSINLNAAVL